MAKQLNIDVNLNTAKASQQLQALQQALTQAIQGAASSSNGKLTKEIVSATEAAVKLKTMLSQAMNVNTGNLDLSKFSQQLAKSGISLQAYAQKLTALGPQGERAFMQMSKAIVSAETPMRQSGKLMNNLWTTMKNTARWQISSMALHTFIGGLQSAFSYARGLNESLNSIRIVTGQSAQEMDAFAQRANKSAKELSASTLDYTDAALIYYQQGIRDQQQIKERTDATIKMANVTGQSAQTVSQQMTAIWNNFADGSKNLEYYADVITALGANTASSSAEIAKGLEKFAAVADTVGLSYEYATSALATIVATTRQSADVVGTALKTLFARIQDLDLGKTLDDGTTLGKYSAALDAVGISIKDQNGELRDMDDILDDMGAKWTTLNKDQQVALAQTVAGTRQYTQLVALMDNWDFMKDNLMVAKGSEGELQKQADIYAESWKAAKTRVKASMQSLYEDLISDDFFIGFNNAIAGALSGLDKFIDAIGGIPGVLGLVGIALTTIFREQFGRVIDNAILNLQKMTGMAQTAANKVRNDASVAAAKFNSQMALSKSAGMETQAMQQQIQLATLLQQKKEALAKTGSKISAGEMNEITSLMEILDLYNEIAIAAQKRAEAEEEATLANTQSLQARMLANATAAAKKNGLTGTAMTAAALEETRASMAQLTSAQEAARSIGILQGALEQIGQTGQLSAEQLELVGKALKTGLGATMINGVNVSVKQLRNELTQLQASLKALKADPNASQTAISRLGKEIALTQERIAASKKINKLSNQADNVSRLWKEAASGNAAAVEAAEQQTKAFVTALQQGLAGKSNILKNVLNNMLASIDVNPAVAKGEELFEAVMQAFKAGKLQIPPLNAEGAAQKLKMDIETAIRQAGVEAGSTLSKTIMNSFHGLSSFAMGLSSIHSAIRALNNEDLSFFEKFTQVTMSVGIGIPMLITGLGSLAATSQLLTNGLKALATQLLINQGASEAMAAAAVAENLSVTGLGRTLVTLIGLKSGYLVMTENGAIATAAGTAANYAEATSFQILAGSIRNAAIALGGFIATAGPVIMAVAGIIAAAYTLNSLIKQANANSPEGQLQAAKEQAQNFDEVLKEVKTTAENLKTTFDNYSSVQDELASCVEGTEEWVDTLREANLLTLELLRNYPELAQYIETDENGRKYISKEGLDALQQDAQNNVVAAELSASGAQKNVSDKELDVKIDSLAQDLLGPFLRYNSNLINKDNLEKLVELEDRPIEDRVQAIQDVLAESAPHHMDANMLQSMAENINKNLFENETDDLINTATDIANEIASNNEYQKAENDLMAQTVLSGNETLKDDKNADNISKAVSNTLQEMSKANIENIKEELREGDTASNQEKYENYLRAKGIEDFEDLKETSTGATYMVGNEEKSLEQSDVATFYGMKQAVIDLQPQIELLSKSFTQLDAAAKSKDLYETQAGEKKETYHSKVENVMARGAKDLLANKDLENLSRGDIDLLLNQNAEQIRASLENVLGEQGLEDMAKSAGFEGSEAFLESFTQGISEADSIWDSIDSEKFVGLDGADQIGRKAAKSLENTIDQINLGPLSSKVGRKGVDELFQGIDKAVSGLDPEKKIEALNKIAEIDFSQTSNAAEAIAGAVQSLGVNLDTTSDFWRAFNQDMQDATGYMPQLESLINQFEELQNVLGELEFGKALQAEDYEKLITQNHALEDSFIQLSDGSYKFIGSQEAASKAVLQNTLDTLDSYNKKSQAANNYMKLLEKEGKTSQFNTEETDANAQRDALKDLYKSEEGKQLLVEVGYKVDVTSWNQLLFGSTEQLEEAYKRVTDHVGEYVGQMTQQQAESFASMAQNIEQLNVQKSIFDNTDNAAVFDEAYNKQAMYFMMTAENAEELINVIEKFKGSLADLPMDSLDALAEKFANVKTELEDIQRLKALGIEGLELAGAEGELAGSIAAAGLAEKYGEGTNAVEAMMHSIAEANGYLDEQDNIMKDQVGTVARLTDQYLGVAQAVANAADKAETYTTQLQDIQSLEKKGDSVGAATAAGYQEIADTLSGLIGVSKDAIKHDYITKVVDPKTFQNACKGDAKAIYSLRNSFVEFQAEADGVSKEVASAFADMMNELGENADIDMGSAAFQNFISELNDINAFAGMTADEIRSKLEQDYNIHVDGLEAIGTFESVEAAMASMAEQGIATQDVIMSMGADAQVEQTEIQSQDSATIANIDAEDKGDTYTVETPQFEGDMTASGSITMSSGGGSIGADGGSFSISPAGSVKFGGSVTASAVPNVLKAGGITENAETEDVEKPKTDTVTAFKMVNPKTGAVGGGGGTNISNRRARTCFVAGTLVSTIKGYKNIENIKIGDIVLSYNENTLRNEYSEVVQTMIHFVEEEIYSLFIGNEIIQATGAHPLYIKRNNEINWIEVSDLHVGDLVMFADKTWHEIFDIQLEIQKFIVYNLEVANNHNYYVGKNKILVHNKGGGCFISGTLIRTHNGYKNIEDIKIGDIVLSYNENTQLNEYNKVISTMIHEVQEKIYDIYIENEIFTATGVHPFYIIRDNWQGWLTVEKLQSGDQVLFADGSKHFINQITFEIKKEIVYNFEVANAHTYYIGINSVLVHNKGCFIEGTQISTDQGFKNIEDVKVNDIVLSYNENTQLNEYNKVLQTMIHWVEEKIYNIYVENEVIKATGIHPFYILRNNKIGWCEAENLLIGDLVMFADTSWHLITKIESQIKSGFVYNLEVDIAHTYYVGNNQILVHNKGGRRRCFVGGTLINSFDGYKNIEDIKIGDIVLSYNENTQLNEYSQVIDTMIYNVNEEIYNLYIENEMVQVTGLHPFYVMRNNIKQWIIAKELKIGDLTLFANHTWHSIKQININIRSEIVYNFEVANNHNYYVGKNSILVHNKGGGGRGRANKHAAVQQKVARREGDIKQDMQHVIDKISRNMEKLNKTTDRVYGKNRIKMQEKILDLYGKELDKIKELNKVKEQEYKDSLKRIKGGKLTTEIQYAKTTGSGTDNEQTYNVVDQADLLKEMKLTDLAKYDEEGYLANMGELTQKAAEWYNKYAKKWEAASADTQATDAFKNEKAKIEAYYEAWKTLTDEINTTYNAWQDGLTEWEDKIYEAHDKFAEMLEYKLQVKIELVDGDLKIIDAKLKNIGDSIYKSVEALSLLWNQNGISSQYDSILEKGTDYMEHWDEINKHYDPAKWQELDQLTQQAYIDQAGEVRDGLLEQAEALIDLREAYEAYYGDTLSKATEEIEKYTRQIEHNANVLKHLQNLLDLTGRQFDYDAKDTLIRGRLSVAADDYQQAANWAALTKENAADAKRQYEELLEIDKLGAERFKKEVLDKAVDYALEAEETMYSKAEEYAGHLEELWENTLNKANDAWERVATMGDGWDYLSDSMERAKAIQEEYLTTTNKLYETNTLLRKLDKDMNNANNQLSKDKLASFAKEVEQAQISNKLAKSSMEILKARYELLQAEMALEDAKDAKAIVRLQRDNEGNYGYVYTADPDKEDDAEQNRADKENDLYNLVLGYQNDYQEKTMQSRREFQEAYSQIWQDFYDGRIATTEERERKLAELKEQYSELWKAYDISLTDSEYWLNQVAATDVSEAWAHSYQDRRSNQQDFMKACKDAHDELDAIMIDINKVRDQLTKDTQLGLSDVKKKTDEVTTANKLLTNELVHDVQPKVDGMIDKVGAATRAFEAHAAEIQNVINKYLTLAQVIQNTMRLQSGYNTPDWSVKTSADIAAKDTIGEAADMKSRSQTVGANHMSKEGGYITNNLENAVIQRISNRAGVQWENTRDTMLSGGVIEGVEGEDKEILSLMASQSSARKVNNSSDETQTFQWLVDQGTPQNVLDALNPTQYNIDWDKITGYKPKGYDTGGYTGAWGDEGKLALLHEKELVLNATDTQNILDTVELLRGITASFNLQAGLENMMASMVTPLFSNNGETLQQEVHITAEFPNVSDRNEIEEAFKTLVNEASQYANRY